MGVYADSSGSPGARVAAYGYDGSGQRIQKILGTGEAAVVTDYYYNQNWQVVQETATAGGVGRNTAYVWGQRYIDTPVCRIAEAYTAGETTVPAQTLYYLTDAHANVTALVDGTAGSATEGQVLERYSYDAGGNVTFLAADWSGQVVAGHDDGTASAFGNEILYSGYRRDAEVGGYQVRHREYLPGLGVWMQRDPWGYVDGMNDVLFVADNPINRVDPKGLFWKELWEWTKSVVGAGATPHGTSELAGGAECAPDIARIVIGQKAKNQRAWDEEHDPRIDPDRDPLVTGLDKIVQGTHDLTPAEQAAVDRWMRNAMR